MRLIGIGSVVVLSLVLAACSSSGGGSPAPATGGAGPSAGGAASAPPNGASSGAGAATTAPASQAAGVGTTASQAAGGGGAATGLAAKPCSLLTTADVESILHGAMVATAAPGRDATTAACNYTSAATGNEVTVNIAEGAAAKTAFDGYAAAGQLGPKVEGIGDAAFYTDGEISVWKGAHGVGISIVQSDAADAAALKALAVALAKIVAGRL